jgi:hypothetical protein
MRKPLLLVVLVAALAGFVFASFSTYDFVQHLDRQVHGLHCSFIPGLTGTDVSGASGCHVALMSPYSSFFRTAIWGGLPISLPAMAVFAFLACRAVLALIRDGDTTREIGWLVIAALIPLLASTVMGAIAATQLSAFCKLCVGIYASSAVLFAAALAAYFARPVAAVADDDYLSYMQAPAELPAVSGGSDPYPAPVAPPRASDPIFNEPTSPGIYPDDPQAREGGFSAGVAVAQGFGFVLLPVMFYALAAPDFSKFIGTCGQLAKPEDPYNVMLSLPGGKGVPAIEVFDPLCPSCKALEERLDASGLGQELDRKLVLFPLDSTCNWMVGSTIHPGACAISEAILCAGTGKAEAVMDWAFEHQEEIRTKAGAAPDPETGEAVARDMAVAQFPELQGCVGSAKVKSQINKSLRWAVSNQLQVLTPQLFVRGTKLCDEDTDIGLDYSLRRLINQQPGSRKEGAP